MLQGVHILDPEEEAYDPAAQFVQTDAPNVAAYLPTKQLTQTPPEVAAVPAAQLIHASAVDAPAFE